MRALQICIELNHGWSVGPVNRGPLSCLDFSLDHSVF
jgi:hypothetical protein